jgi:hypothetical protein
MTQVEAGTTTAPYQWCAIRLCRHRSQDLSNHQERREPEAASLSERWLSRGGQHRRVGDAGQPLAAPILEIVVRKFMQRQVDVVMIAQAAA